jgi:protein transport protein SEC24
MIGCSLFSIILAIDKAVTIKIRDGKGYLIQQTSDICSAYSKEVVGVVPSKSSQLNLCRSLSLLPALMLALLKSVSIIISISLTARICVDLL